MADPLPQPTEWALLDVLDILPLDVVERNIWWLLTDRPNERTPRVRSVPHPGSSSRNSSSRAFRLVCRGALRLANLLTRRVALPVLAQHSSAEAGGAFLARLGWVQTLQLGISRDPCVEDLLVGTLQRAGAAALQRVQVDVTYSQECGAALHTLTLLPGLQTLRLAGPLCTAGSLLWLAALTAVTELSLHGLEEGAPVADGHRLGAVLGALTQLRRLQLPHWVGKHLRTAALNVVNAAAGHLGSLRGLTALSLGSSAEESWAGKGALGASGVGALRQLTALTSLSSPAFALSHGQGCGLLPRVRRLHITSQPDGDGLLCTLQTLAPLRELVAVRLHVYIPEEDSWGRGGAMSAWHAGRLLAGVRCAADMHVDLFLDHNGGRSEWTGAATALLLPLQGLRLSLTLQHAPTRTVESLWAVLQQAARLESLHMCRVELPQGLLPLVGQHLPALRRLVVDSCSAGGAGLSAASALELARVRSQPLRIAWSPRRTPEEEREFAAAAREGVCMCAWVPPVELPHRVLW